MAAAALVIVSMCGCDGSPASDPSAAPRVVRYGPAPADTYKPMVGRRGGQIVLASFGEGPKSFNPITAAETSTTDYTDRIFDNLLFSDPWTQEIKPNLAESWEHCDDFLVWTFRLRTDILFNNGLPLTADDVVFTIETIYDGRITSSARDIMTVDGKQWTVEKLDDHTVRFTLPTPYAIFLEVLSNLKIVSRQVCEPAVRAGTFNAFMGADAAPDQVVGTGPFMLEYYESGLRLNLKRNPYYWKYDSEGARLPYLDRMVFLWVKNIDAVMLRFKTGETDGYGLRGSDYPLLKPLERKNGFRIYELGPTMSKSFLVFNQNTGTNPNTSRPYVDPHKLKWFRSTTFRQAISHAIDRVGLIRAIHNGLARRMYGPMGESAGYFHNPGIRPFPYDLDKARRMLSGIGLEDRSGDGWLTDEEGRELRFTLFTNAGNNLREQTAEIVRKDLERLGIRVNLKYIEFNTLISKIDETYDWEAIILGLTGGTEPHFSANIWKSSGRLAIWHPKQTRPSTPWEARIDEIFAAGIKEMDRVERKKLYDEWQMIANEQQPFIYTVAPLVLYAFRDRFDNVYPTVLAAAGRKATTWNIEEIFVRESER